MKPKVAEKKDPPADPPSIKNLRIDSNPNTEENNSHATQKLTQESPGHSRRSGALRKLAKGEKKSNSKSRSRSSSCEPKSTKKPTRRQTGKRKSTIKEEDDGEMSVEDEKTETHLSDSK